MTVADSRAPKQRIRSDRLLLVEGRDEVNLFGELLEHCFDVAGRQTIQIIDVGGREKFGINIAAINAATERCSPLRALGIIRDADDSADSAFQSVCDALRNTGYVPPPVHGDVSGGMPAVGVFILPDGEGAGAIETLCRHSIAGGAASSCVETYIECLKDRGVLHSRNEDKTFTHAWLAAGEDPVARVGEGARQGVWDFGSDAFADLSAFLRNLFEPAR